MKRRSILTLGIVALALALAAPFAFARGPGGGEGRGHGKRGQFLKEELGLDDKQVEALKVLREDLHNDVDDIREQIDVKQKAITELWKAPSPDRNKILAATAEIAKLEAQIDTLRVDHMFAVKAELTPEQFGKFVEMAPQRGKHGRFGGKHGGKHGGFEGRRQWKEQKGAIEEEVH